MLQPLFRTRSFLSHTINKGSRVGGGKTKRKKSTSAKQQTKIIKIIWIFHSAFREGFEMVLRRVLWERERKRWENNILKWWNFNGTSTMRNTSFYAFFCCARGCLVLDECFILVKKVKIIYGLHSKWVFALPYYFLPLTQDVTSERKKKSPFVKLSIFSFLHGFTDLFSPPYTYTNHWKSKTFALKHTKSKRQVLDDSFQIFFCTIIGTRLGTKFLFKWLRALPRSSCGFIDVSHFTLIKEFPECLETLRVCVSVSDQSSLKPAWCSSHPWLSFLSHATCDLLKQKYTGGKKIPIE